MRFADYVVDYALQVNNQSLRALIGASDKLAPKVVHGLRVNVKRLRSAWQIVRHDVERKESKAAAKRLRLIHKTLAPSRDHEVIVKTLGKLRSKASSGKTSSALERLAAEMGTVHAGAVDGNAVALGFQRESRCWRELDLGGMSDWELIDRGIGGNIRAGRRLGKAYAAGGGEALLHRWRKHAKHSLYQLEIVKPALGEANLARRWYLERLADGLGLHQDLCMVEAALAESSLAPKARQRIAGLIADRKLTLESRAMKLFSHLYADKPARIVEDLIADIERLALGDIVWLPSRMA